MVILKVWYVCQIICIAGDVQRQKKKIWARDLIASGSFIHVSIVNDTLPFREIFMAWMKITPFFPENN